MSFKQTTKILLPGFLAMSAGLATASQSINWTNPGGMWPPSAIYEQRDLLTDLGLEIPPENLSDPSSSTLQAIVSLGYCSGSFISDQGLIITNHHCVQGMLSYLTNKDRADTGNEQIDYVYDGFHAHKNSQERNAGPTERIYVTQSQEDVTEKVTGGLSDIKDPLTRGQMIQDRIKKIVSEEEAKEPNIKAEVRSFYRDETFLLIKKLELKDIRMVYAPPQGVGFFGGDSDNWVWPRHVGDFAIIRAYVGKDGSSQTYSPDNVPYKPANILKVASDNNSWVKNQDLVLVAGFPGSTNRLDTADEVKDEISQSIPHLLKKYGSLRELLGFLSEQDDGIRKKLSSKIFSLDNFLKNRKKALEALDAVGYLDQKQDEQEQFASWIRGDKERAARWGQALEGMEALRKKFQDGWKSRAMDSDLIYGFSAGLSHIVASAVEIVRMAEERPKPDADRHPDYQERKWKSWLQGEESAQNQYDQKIAISVMKWALERAVQMPDEDIPDSVRFIIDVDAARDRPELIQLALDKLFGETQMEDLSYRTQLYKNASLDDLAQSEDPVIALALKLAPVYVDATDRAKVIRGSYLDYAPAYIKALKAWKQSQGQHLAPDANSTLRITFGHVKGYVRPSDQSWQSPFTNLLDLHTKHVWGDSEYEVPAPVLRELHKKNFEPYTDISYGNVPVNFLAAVDTTGGNSGSAALNTKGELIGLLFDGNQDALYSDWVFKDEGVRSILVDIRYALWMLDKVADAKEILSEIGFGEKGE